MNEQAVTISVVTPTYNRLARLQRVLAALAAQTYSPDRFEVVIVSDGSTDGTADYCRQVQMPFRLHFIQQENAGWQRRAIGEWRQHGAHWCSFSTMMLCRLPI